MSGIQTYKGLPKPGADNTALYTDLPQAAEIKDSRRLDLLTYLTASLVLAVLAMAAVMARQQIQIIDLQTSNDKLEMYMRTFQRQYHRDEAVSDIREHEDMTSEGLHHHQGSAQGDIADPAQSGEAGTSTRIRRSNTNNRTGQQPCVTDSHQIHALHMYASKQHVMSGMNITSHESFIARKDVEVEAGSINWYDGFTPAPGPLKIWDNMRWPASRYEYFADIRRTPHEGIVVIVRDGLYLIYVQVTFQTAVLHQSISVILTDKSNRASTIASCIVSERFETSTISGRDSASVYLLCPITSTYYLFAGSSLHLESTYEGRRIMLNQFLTYWGIVYLN